MSGQVIGYVRVSTVDQNTERQLEGISVDRVFRDSLSGGAVKRPGLDALLEYIREGDKLVVHSMDRLARNLKDLETLVSDLTGRGIQIVFVKENLTFSGDDSPMAVLMLQIMGAFAQFERSLIKERQREGIALAKKRGVYLGRKPKLSQDQVAEMLKRSADGENKSLLAKEFGVSRPTLYRLLKITP